MSLRSISYTVCIICMLSAMFMATGCSILAYSDMEPENPYGDPPEHKNIAVGFNTGY